MDFRRGRAAAIRPWYQDFTLGPPHYGVAQVRAQIQAGYDNGIGSVAYFGVAGADPQSARLAA